MNRKQRKMVMMIVVVLAGLYLVYQFRSRSAEQEAAALAEAQRRQAELEQQAREAAEQITYVVPVEMIPKRTVITDRMVMLLVGTEPVLEAVEDMMGRHATDDLVMVLGYGTVGSEAAAFLRRKGVPHVIVERSPRPHFDLFAANEAQLLEAGLAPAHVFNSRMCTSCREDLFYSWRRDRAVTGRMQAAIAALEKSPA